VAVVPVVWLTTHFILLVMADLLSLAVAVLELHLNQTATLAPLADPAEIMAAAVLQTHPAPLALFGFGNTHKIGFNYG
jgi:hypothetical protein